MRGVDKHRSDELYLEIIAVFFGKALYRFPSEKRNARIHPLVEIELGALVADIAVPVTLRKMKGHQDLRAPFYDSVYILHKERPLPVCRMAQDGMADDEVEFHVEFGTVEFGVIRKLMLFYRSDFLDARYLQRILHEP